MSKEWKSIKFSKSKVMFSECLVSSNKTKSRYIQFNIKNSCKSSYLRSWNEVMFSIFSLKIDDQICDVAGEQRHHESKRNISNGYTFNV